MAPAVASKHLEKTRKGGLNLVIVVLKVSDHLAADCSDSGHGNNGTHTKDVNSIQKLLNGISGVGR